MNMTNLIEPGRVLCNVDARSKKHALEILSELLSAGQPSLGQGEVFECLVSRERLGSTGLGDGVSVPHCRVDGITKSIGAFIKLSEPVNYDAPDGQPVILLFGLLVPMECDEIQLRYVAELERMFSDSDFRDTLIRVNRSRILYEMLTQHGQNHQASA